MRRHLQLTIETRISCGPVTRRLHGGPGWTERRSGDSGPWQTPPRTPIATLCARCGYVAIAPDLAADACVNHSVHPSSWLEHTLPRAGRFMNDSWPSRVRSHAVRTRRPAASRVGGTATLGHGLSVMCPIAFVPRQVAPPVSPPSRPGARHPQWPARS